MSTADTRQEPRMVGVDLQESTEETRAIVAAIERDNPGSVVRHMPGLVKIQAPHRLVVRRESVEELLGRPWETPAFQLAIVSYYGHVEEWDDDEIVIQWSH
jgi:phenol hydroxylase P2 protein